MENIPSELSLITVTTIFRAFARLTFTLTLLGPLPLLGGPQGRDLRCTGVGLVDIQSKQINHVVFTWTREFNLSVIAKTH